MIGLGAYHGINPGMGWLFAVALGMQAGHVHPGENVALLGIGSGLNCVMLGLEMPA